VSTEMTRLAPAQPSSAPFDAVAEQYDDLFTSSLIGQAQRTAVWREIKNSFRPGDRILEIGCGTGVDARFMADHGIHVLACDSSTRMLGVAERRLASTAKYSSGGPIQLRLLPAEGISMLKKYGPFDGAFSNFGAVNCMKDLPQLANDLAVLLKPGGTALLCLIGPHCLWEIGWYLFQGKGAKAFRRFHRGGVDARLGDGVTVHVQYPSVRFMSRMFSPKFRLRTIRGIGVAVPPSYVEPWASRFPGMVRLGVRADSILGRCPGTRTLADHVLLKFERLIA